MRSPPATHVEPEATDLTRAARLLWVRSQRAASHLVTGGYTSAFRGGGMEFEDSRPYVYGDDVRHVDWNATARTGDVFVKRFREERDQTLILVLDVSASMRFASGERSKAVLASHVASMLAVAAGFAGDRVGLVAFRDRVVREIRPGQGDAHAWSIVRAAVQCAAEADGRTGLAAALARLSALTRHRAIVVVLSDFRDGTFDTHPGPPARRGGLAALARRHDLVAGIIHDPREHELPDVGPIRVADPERPGRTRVIDSGSRRVRARYRAACEVRRIAVERRLRRDGVDVLRLRTDRDPLPALVGFFRHHAGRVHGGAS